MCLRPIMRENPYFDPSHNGSLRRAERFRSAGQHLVGMHFRNKDEKYIPVPCNVCPACIAMRQNDIVQRAQVEARYSHVFMLTFTYDNKHLPRIPVPVSAVPDGLFDSPEWDGEYDFDSVPLDPLYIEDLPETDEERSARLVESGAAFLQSLQDAKDAKFAPFELPEGVVSTDMAYAKHEHLQDCIRHARNDLFTRPEFQDRKVKYLGVSELGGQKGRPHFHLLLFVEKKPDDFVIGLRYNGPVSSNVVKPSIVVGLTGLIYDWFKDNWAVNLGTKKHPRYEPLYTFIRVPDPSSCTGWRCTFDCHYVRPEASDSGSDDVAFYVTKYIMKASDKEIKRKVFLKNNLDPGTFDKFWKIVRCRMFISKGFGVHSETVVNDEGRHCIKPDVDVLRKINADCRLDAGKSPGPVFVTDLGVHRPLSRYYFDKHVGDVYAWTVEDLQFISDAYPVDAVPSWERGPAFVRQKEIEFEKRKNLMNSHEIL